MTNQELQLLRIETLLKNGLSLQKESLGEKCDLNINKEYDIKKILKNINNNYFFFLPTAIENLLKDPYVNINVLYNNLLNYRYINDNNGFEIIDKEEIEETLLQGKVGLYNPDLFSEETIPFIYLRDTEKENFSVVVHEMYHFASLIDELDIGFSKGTLGRGIDEGFTQYLTNIACNNGRELYYENGVYTTTYCFSTSYANSLVTLLGLDKMKNIYFNSGYNGLIDELSKYQDRNEIIDFISNIDYILDNETLPKDDIDLDKFYDKVDECNAYLTEMWYSMHPGEDMPKHFLVGISEQPVYLATDKIVEECSILENKQVKE